MNELKSEEAKVAGVAERIPAALKAQPGTLTATIQITRKATGEVEEYTITGTPEVPEHQESK